MQGVSTVLATFMCTIITLYVSSPVSFPPFWRRVTEFGKRKQLQQSGTYTESTKYVNAIVFSIELKSDTVSSEHSCDCLVN